VKRHISNDESPVAGFSESAFAAAIPSGFDGSAFVDAIPSGFGGKGRYSFR